MSEDYTFEIPVTINVTVSRDTASARMPSALAKARASQIETDLDQLAHIEDLTVEDPQLLQGPNGAAYTRNDD